MWCLKSHCCAESSLYCVSPQPVTMYLSSLLFSLRAEPLSLWTNTFRETSAPPQNHFYRRPRQYTCTKKGLKRPGLHASSLNRCILPVQRWCTCANIALILFNVKVEDDDVKWTWTTFLSFLLFYINKSEVQTPDSIRELHSWLFSRTLQSLPPVSQA